MSQKRGEQILTQTDLDILAILINKKEIPKGELHKKFKKKGKEKHRINDRINKLESYHLIKQVNGFKRRSKKIILPKGKKKINFINSLIKIFGKSHVT